MQDINQNARNLGYNISAAYKNAGNTGIRNLARSQKKNLGFIKKVYAKALEAKETKKNLFLPVHFEWLCDNYYIIEREVKNICKSLSYVSKLPALRKYPKNLRAEIRIYAILNELISNYDGEITPQILEDYIKAVQTGDNYLSINEFSLVRIMLAASVCSEIYNICVKLFEYLGNNTDSLPDNLAHSLGYCVRNLRFCSIYKFEALFEKCSKADEIFNRDPAGIYKNMDKDTKDYYRRRLSEIAKENNCAEIETAEKIYYRALDEYNNHNENEKKAHVGYYLLKKNSPKKSYFFIMFSILIALIFLGAQISGTSVIFLVFVLWELAKQITDFIFSRFIKTAALPKLELKEIPDDKKTLVCITTLLFGEGKDDSLFNRLENYYNCNKDKNINFSILGDFKDNKDKETQSDSKIINYAISKIEELNKKYNNSFSLFIRERVYSKSEKRYMGWERKRGALIELVRFIKCVGATTFSTVIGDIDFIKDVKYIITLDADTNLGIGNAKDMLSAMLHPNAKPVFDENKKIVVDGYGIMQPRMGADLSASSKTAFTRMMCGSGGIDIYSSAAFDLYQEIYGEGNFCGKGIFDVDIFYKTLDGAYPEETVLSHDLLEGTRLRCALISDLELTDGIPKNPASYYDRLHRWIRGDMQALNFIGAKTKTADGKIIKNPITVLSKYKIFDNARRASLPVFSILAMIASLLFYIFGSDSNYYYYAQNRFPLNTAVLAVLYIIFPMVSGIISIFMISSFQNISKRFSSKVITSIWQNIFNTLFDLSALAYKAFVSFDAIMRSLFRMIITKRKMLSWVTASEGEMQLKGLALYIRKMFLSSALGLAFMIFAPYGIYKILGIMWLFFPVTAYIMGKETDESTERKLSEKHEDKLKSYISDMWKFYTATVNKRDNYLPPDNIQFFPIESTAHRTSPTNIGLYMLSVLCARDFELIDTKTLCSKIDSTVSTVEKMEKWNGHLYNWYDTKNLNVIGSRFVSTVDSGNFAACLTALKEGIKEYAPYLQTPAPFREGGAVATAEVVVPQTTSDSATPGSAEPPPSQKGAGEISPMQNIIQRIEKILGDINFYALYNQSRDLFYIGYDEESNNFGENCYDLYMSESKITSYFAIARGEIPKKHWQKLGRTLIKENGYMGLASWTGTAFEYFMPNLLLPLYKNSLTYEAHKFALREQAKRRGKYNGTEVWGISESGFYAFDFDMNYQYQAFGVQKLGLKRGLNKELVISPYSSFLALSIAPGYSMNNLARLEKISMYGKYGFYEACDFTHCRAGRGVSVVKSYMAHHVGMSIIAAANICLDNIFQKRFMKDASQRSAYELLQEKIPVDAIIFEDINSREVPEKINRSYGLIEKNTGKINLENPVCRLISNSKSRIIASSSGDIMLSDGIYTINYIDFDRYNNTKPFSVMFKYNGEVFSQSKIPVNRDNAEYLYEFTDSYAHYSVKEIIDSVHITGEVSYSLISDMSCFVINAGINITNVGRDDPGAPVKEQKLRRAESSRPTNNSSKIEIMLYFEPIIAKLADFKAHPAFSSLSVEAEYDEKNNILFYKRRPMHENESEKWLAVTVDTIDTTGTSGNFVFETRRDDILPHLYDETDIANLFHREFKNTDGACINPVCAIKSDAYASQKNKNHYEAVFYIAFANKKDDALNILKNAGLKNIEKENRKIAENSQNRMIVSGITSKEKNLLDIILSCIHCKTLNNKPHKDDITGLSASIKMLWKEGISGDLPIVLLAIKEEDNEDNTGIFEEYLHVYKYLNLSGQKYDFVVIYSEIEKYNRPCKNKIYDMLKKNGCEHFLKKRGGIFILDKANIDFNQTRLLYSMASYKYEIKTGASSIFPKSQLSGNHDNYIEKIPKIITAVKGPLPRRGWHEVTGVGEFDGVRGPTTPAAAAAPPSEKGAKEFKNFVFDEPVYEVEGGYFTDNAFYINCAGKKAPWSHIISNRQFGTLVTHKSLGFTWYSNSRERRLTAWENDPVSDMQSERLILSFNSNSGGEKYDLCAIAAYLKIFPNGAEYYGRIKNLEYKICVTVDDKLFVKLIEASFYPVYPDYTGYTGYPVNENESGTGDLDIEVSYLIKPVMGVAESKLNFVDINDIRGDTISFRNICNMDFYGYTGFIRAIGGKIKSHDILDFLTDSKISANEIDYIAVSKSINVGIGINPDRFENKAVFALGCYKSVKYFDYVYEKLGDLSFTDKMTERSRDFIINYMPKIKLNSSNKAFKPFDVMFNTFLPYQNIVGRIFGRTGFYQSSGAYGYRDQLQDMMGLVYCSPELVKAHIYRAAAHQFIEEGDVLHWWHNIKTPESKAHRGVRTRCSDDYLWLPYVTAFYINKTGDTSILKTKIEYLADAPLGKYEKERYNEPGKSGIRENIYEHCKKSIEYGLKFGEHGLPLIGSGDWNDGMTLVGAEGKGESVWLGQFLILTLRSFIPVCEKTGDSETARKYKSEAEKIKDAIELYCFENDRYIRGFYDNGEKLGSKESDECKIDILPQAFSAMTVGTPYMASGGGHDNNNISYPCEESIERAKIALNTAYNNLFDKKYKILKLFTPAFNESVQNPGYIKGYVPGIRENGGQYTHAAAWGALGFLSLGNLCRGDYQSPGEFYKKSWEIIKALNPAIRCSDKELADIYRIEPYVLSGDIYSNEAHAGRGGWSWYTGSAAWYYRLILEGLLGFEFSGDKFAINPEAVKYIQDFDNISVELKLKESIYNINISKNSENLKNTGTKIYIDSKEAENPIKICGGEHKIDIIV
ncbi:MAG: hypothetical protein FWF92_03355 [Oscillospiraceae bacterium]|nr:hypothetical protein [Oscillospiraceae bacterium]